MGDKDIASRIISEFNKTHSIKPTAKAVGCSWNRVVKILSSSGIVINDLHAQILDMQKAGIPLEKIAEMTGKNIKTVQAYLPAQRPFYGGNPSKNAMRINFSRGGVPKEIPLGHAENLAGKVFGDFEAIYRTRLDRPGIYWYCKNIKTGKKRVISADALKNGIFRKRKEKPGQHKDYRKFKDADLSILTPKEREALLIKIEDADAKTDDIAQKIGVSAKSVPVLLNKAVKKLNGTYPWEEVRERNSKSESHKAAMRKYYQEHKDELKEYKKAYAKDYYQERKEEYAARNAAYYQAHKDEIKQRARERYTKSMEGKDG